MDFDLFDWAYGIVPLDYPQPTIPTPTSPPARLPAPTQDYSQPWYVDTINRAIERAAQVATVHSAGYPPYPTYPTPTPSPAPLPYPLPVASQPSGAGIQLSTNTLMLLAGGFLLFTLGQRKRR